MKYYTQFSQWSGEKFSKLPESLQIGISFSLLVLALAISTEVLTWIESIFGPITWGALFYLIMVGYYMDTWKNLDVKSPTFLSLLKGVLKDKVTIVSVLAILVIPVGVFGPTEWSVFLLALIPIIVSLWNLGLEAIGNLEKHLLFLKRL